MRQLLTNTRAVLNASIVHKNGSLQRSKFRDRFVPVAWILGGVICCAQPLLADVLVPKQDANKQDSIAEVLHQLVDAQKSFDDSQPDISGYAIVWLGDLPGGRFYSAAQDINEHDTVVGFGSDAEGTKATVWRKIDLQWVVEPLPSKDVSVGYVITNNDVVGGRHGYHPAVWTFDKKAEGWRLEELPGDGTVYWLSEDGLVAAGAITRNGVKSPAKWDRNEAEWVMVYPKDDEPAPLEPFVRKIHKDVFATGFNERGAITGYSQKNVTMEIPVPANSGGLLNKANQTLLAADTVQEGLVAFPGSGGMPMVGPAGSASSGPAGGGMGAPAGFGGAGGGGGGFGVDDGILDDGVVDDGIIDDGIVDDSDGVDDRDGVDSVDDGTPVVPEPASAIAWALAATALGAGWGISQLRRRWTTKS